MLQKHGIRTLIAAICMVALLCQLPVFSLSAAAAALAGDLNQNGKVDIQDALTVYQYTAGRVLLNSEQLSCADLNSDNRVDLTDAYTLYRIADGEQTDVDDTNESFSGGTQPLFRRLPLDAAGYYGRTLLAAESEKLLAAYESIGEQVASFTQRIDLIDLKLTVPEQEKALRYYYDDHPGVFWLDLVYTRWTWKEDGVSYVAYLDMQYAYTKDEATTYLQRLEETTQELLEPMMNERDDLVCERYVHDTLIRICQYDFAFANKDTHKSLGPLLNGTGACNGYSRAFQYLMLCCGIQTIMVGGTTASGAGHSWNAVSIGENWYFIDVTWDDPTFEEARPAYVEYTYFNVTSEKMKETHTWNQSYCTKDSTYAISYPIPECNAVEANIMVVMATDLERFDVEIMAPIVAQSIREDSEAVFRPACGPEEFLVEFDRDENFFALVYAVNEILKEEPDIMIGSQVVYYHTRIDEQNGLATIYMR